MNLATLNAFPQYHRWTLVDIMKITVDIHDGEVIVCCDIVWRNICLIYLSLVWFDEVFVLTSSLVIGRFFLALTVSHIWTLKCLMFHYHIVAGITLQLLGNFCNTGLVKDLTFITCLQEWSDIQGIFAKRFMQLLHLMRISSHDCIDITVSKCFDPRIHLKGPMMTVEHEVDRDDFEK